MSGTASGPAVGNVLGFSLLFRERKALLRLERRAIAPGLHIGEYEAQIPNVAFPFKGPSSVATFRHRRCRALRATLEIEQHAILSWIEERLRRHPLCGIRVQHVDLELRGRPDLDRSPLPCLYLEGRTSDGRWIWAMIAVRDDPDGRRIVLRPERIWIMGDPWIDPMDLWKELTAALGRRRDPGDVVAIDPVAEILARPFVASGWKAPDVESLGLVEVAVKRRHVAMTFAAEQERVASQPSHPTATDDPITGRIAIVRDAQAARRHPVAVRELARAIESMGHVPRARRAALRWLVELTRRGFPGTSTPEQRARQRRHCIAALRAWLQAAPNDPDAARLFVEQLGIEGAYRELLRFTSQVAELPHPPQRRARLELALASLRVDKLDEAALARPVLESLRGRALADPALTSVRLPTLVTLAQALADEPSRALEILDLALEHARGPDARAAASASVAEALIRRGHPERALELLRRAVREAPHDDRIVDAAIDLATKLGEHRAAVELLRMSMATAEGDEALELHRRLIERLLELPEPGAGTEARAELDRALERWPHDPVLARMRTWVHATGSGPDRARGTPSPEPPPTRRPTGPHELEDALRVLQRRAENASPDDPAPWRRLADAHAAQGNADGELAARREQGLRHLAAGDCTAAASAFARCCRRAPDDLGLRIALAESLAGAGELRGALHAYDHVVSALGDDTTLHLDARVPLPPTCTAVLARAAALAAEAEDGERRSRYLRRLLEMRVGSRSVREAWVDDPGLGDVLRQLAECDSATDQELLVLADDEDRRGERERADLLRLRAVDRMPTESPARVTVTLQIATRQLEAGRSKVASEVLGRLPDPEALDQGALESLLRLADALGDRSLERRALEVLESRTHDGNDRVRLILRLTALMRSAGEKEQAIARLQSARRWVDPGSPLHLELAATWLATARENPRHVREEADARAELRRALGPSLPSTEARAEIMLLAHDLGQPSRAIALASELLLERPADPILLSTLKEIGLAAGSVEPYLDALERAAAGVQDVEAADNLWSELALVAMENDAPARTLRAVERLSPEVAARADTLDLRAWAVHRLGREDQELQAIRERLLADPHDPEAVARLERIMEDPTARAEYLVVLSNEEGAPPALSDRALALAVSTDDSTLAIRAMRRAWEAGLRDRVLDAFLRVQVRAVQEQDEGAIADLVWLAHQDTGSEASDEVHNALRARAEHLLEQALAVLPTARRLHRSLWELESGEGPQLQTERFTERLNRIIQSQRFAPEVAAELWIHATELMDRKDAARILLLRGEQAIDEPKALSLLLEVLQDRGYIPEMLRLLQLVAESADAPEQKLSARKRLAHLCSDVLRDRNAAIRHLEAALELAPDDPDLLLPLLDYSFEQNDLSRAIDLTERVLERVPMGPAAYVTLAHRAADAAVAQNDYERALALLRQAALHLPDDRRTLERVREIEALQGDPSHRVHLLATIAERQRGTARIEALEERAKLLAEVLGRSQEAIADLERVVLEAPGHRSAELMLERLYEREERWRDLVALLERTFPRQHGVERCKTLRRIADLHRRRLLDLPRAEQALRLALDNLGPEREHADLAEAMRKELVADLEAQGRYVDLSIYLERTLAPEIEGRVEPQDLHPARGDLLVQLARIYRGPLDDETKAARIYERLEAYQRLPDEGLATLARAYHRAGRQEALVRILSVRSRTLGEAGELLRKATVDQRIAEILEGPLGRPHEAADYYLEAYLADPENNAHAGTRARVLLAGTDAVVNVRRRLLERLPRLPLNHRPALLTLLGDILAPHEDYEAEAEARYREALSQDPNHAFAREALGRLLARQGRLDEAVEPLVAASEHPDIAPQRAAEDAAIAARALLELDRPQQAERVLKQALQRAPDSQRALLELARLYERLQRTTEQAIVLENLSQLHLPSMLGAEVAYRRAMLLLPGAREDPYSPEAERARAYLLEAVGADGKHAAARQTLLELAKARLEWSVVAHMHYLAVRELSPGPARALVHLDLAEVYLAHLGDVESATRNIESAVRQAPGDLVVCSRAGSLARRLPEPGRVAERFERIAATADDLDDGARARLWLLSADLRMSDDDPEAAEQASQRVLRLGAAPDDAAAAATRKLEALGEQEARELRQQKSGLIKLLEREDQAIERLHILGRLREIGQSLGDGALVEWSGKQQIELAAQLGRSDTDLDATSTALRDVFAERGAYEEVVELYEQLALRSDDPARKAEFLVEAARFCWQGQRQPVKAAAILRRALAYVPDFGAALQMLGEVTRDSDDPELEAAVYEEIKNVDPSRRPPALDLQLADLAAGLGRYREAMALLRPLTVQTKDAEIRYRALRQLDSILARVGQPTDRLPVLRRHLEESMARKSDDIAMVAVELARVQWTLDDRDGALRTCREGLEVDPAHRGLLVLLAELLEARQEWNELATVLERLAEATDEPAEQAHLLTSAARIRLEHQADEPDPSAATATALDVRRLLVRACELAPRSPLPRSVLLPLSFSEGRWDEVVQLGSELRALAGEDEEVLILAALAEAYCHGHHGLGRALGFRHGPDLHARYLYPGLRHLLTTVAVEGPLPRLDTLLASAALLTGGRDELTAGLRRWATGRPLQAGLSLGLARLTEAEGNAELARCLYQICAFMAPDGPVPALVSRLPPPDPLPDPRSAATGSLEGSSMFLTVMARLRPLLGRIGERPRRVEVPRAQSVRTRIALADAVVDPWRRHFGLALPVRWSNAAIPGGVGVRNDVEPTILVTPGIGVASLAELRFRLAWATATVAMGLAIVEDPEGVPLVSLLRALPVLIDSDHEPSDPTAKVVSDALLGAGSFVDLAADEKAALAAELEHWLEIANGVERLHTVLRRAEVLFATRLSGQLDGALLALAHDMGLVKERRPDPVATLRTEEAHWLLRGLGLY